jgi:signal transduction histidine kinase/ActR/RegA family two-component response regulator
MAKLSALKLLRALDESVASKTGAAFFPQLVSSLAQTLNASCAFVSEIDEETYRANVLAMWRDGAFAETFAYALSGTPCERVLENQIVAFPRQVQQHFPADREGLARLGAESFLAIPLSNETGKVRGHIAVLDRRERDWNEADFGILRIFSARADAELERRDYERRLEELNAALQSANAQLRRELLQRLDAEERLAQAKRAAEQAQRSAEEANRAKSNFLAHMSHELRTPLNGILGYAQLLRRDASLRTEQLQGLSVIESSGEHLLTLVNDLLDLAKIEAGRLELHAKRFNLPKLLKHAADVAAVRARDAGLTFAFHLPPELPTQVHGDERAVRQVLLNLLGNAVKFTPQGGVVFRVLALTASPDRCTVRFRIEDSGPGIAREDLERIFEPFTRASIGSSVEGTGLGLPITKRLVDAMGGRLEVESGEGGGSIFTFELDMQTAERSGVDHGVVEQIIGYEGSRRRVLVVDNDATSRELLARLLDAVGIATREASGGGEALHIAAAEQVDLIVTDLAMPEMTGLELTQKVRADERLHGVPILAVSASVSAFTREEALGAGCDGFVGKPVHADELFAAIGPLLHLSWKTMDRPADEPAGRKAHVDGIRLDQRWAAELYDLAMKGDVKELVSRAEGAALGDPAGAPLYQEVKRLARTFDMRAVRRLLQDAREDSA